MLTTYILRAHSDSPQPLMRFIERARSMFLNGDSTVEFSEIPDHVKRTCPGCAESGWPDPHAVSKSMHANSHINPSRFLEWWAR